MRLVETNDIAAQLQMLSQIRRILQALQDGELGTAVTG
jgi:hypothetical protein